MPPTTAPPATGTCSRAASTSSSSAAPTRKTFTAPPSGPGYSRSHPHSLRHFYASTALAEGIPITDVSRWLGHKSIEVTHQIYGHLVPASFDRARTALDAAYQTSRRQRPRKAAS